MIYRIWYSCLLLIFNHIACVAQIKYHNSSIQINTGRFAMPGISPSLIQTGLDMERYITPKVSIGATYQRWFWKFWRPSASFSKNSLTWYSVLTYKDVISSENIGKRSDMYNYSFVDIDAKYYLKLSNSHILYLGGGLAYAQGFDVYLVDVQRFSGYPDLHIFKSEHYFTRHYGANVLAGYNYLFLKQRFSIGWLAKLRYYTSDMVQYNINIVLGYNFSFLKSKTTNISEQ